MPDLEPILKKLRKAADDLKKARRAEKAAGKKFEAAHAAMLKAADALLQTLSDPHASKQGRQAAAARAANAGETDRDALDEYGRAKRASEKAKKEYGDILIDLVGRLLGAPFAP